MKKQILKNNEKVDGITLIALIITIIVILILAGVSIAMLTGENGIIGRANWSKFVTEYRTVEEAKQIYELNNMTEEKATGNRNKLASKSTDIKQMIKLATTNTEQTQNNKYPITEENITNYASTLGEIIKYTEKIEEITEENVQLYKVDMDLLNLQIQDEYVINIKTGELYKLKGTEYKNHTYHTPNYGINKNGEVTETEKEDTKNTIYLKIDEIKDITKWVEISGNDLEWISGDETIVTVDQQGNVKGIAKGEATVTLRHKVVAEDTEATDDETGGEEEQEETEKQEFKIIVENGIPKNFTLTIEDKEIYEYDTETIEVKIDGKRIGTSYVEFTNSNEDIATISATGEVTGIAQGETQITATWKEDNTKTATGKIKVKVNPNLILDKTKMNVTINQSAKITAKYQGTDVTNTATWESEDTNIVTVSKGKVTGKALGTTKIKVTYNDAIKYCEVTVKDLVEEVYTIEDLSLLQAQVAGGANFADRTVKLMSNLDFKDAKSYESTESAEYAKYYTNYTNNVYTTASSWTTIGGTTSKYFKGTFDGKGKKISNLYINGTVVYQGLFGYSNGGTFKNINLEGTNITSNKANIGSVLGYRNSSKNR